MNLFTERAVEANFRNDLLPLLDEFFARRAFSPFRDRARFSLTTTCIAAEEIAVYQIKLASVLGQTRVFDRVEPLRDQDVPRHPIILGPIGTEANVHSRAPWRREFAQCCQTVVFNETGRISNCQNCNARGTVTCDSCSGLGEVSCQPCDARGVISCGECHGSGEVQIYGPSEQRKEECRNCRGRGTWMERQCSHCFGRGERYYSHRSRVGQRCGRCRARGEIRCSNCNGSGAIDCRNCRTRGVVTCTNCAGLTQLLTRTCCEYRENVYESSRNLV